MEGGAIVGYCSTGIRRIDSAPPSMMSSAITIAKMGRSIKNLAMTAPPYRAGAAGAAACATATLLPADCACGVAGEDGCGNAAAAGDVAFGAVGATGVSTALTS